MLGLPERTPLSRSPFRWLFAQEKSHGSQNESPWQGASGERVPGELPGVTYLTRARLRHCQFVLELEPCRGTVVMGDAYYHAACN